MRIGMIACGLSLVTVSSSSGEEPVLRRSDVVFMYQADRETYEQYGATVLAWGGKPTPKSKAAADQAGVRFFGSVGMVTEFRRYYERFPQTYELGLCRDVDGQPVKVPWLTDHQHKGIPYWWCCTQQPQFRQFLRERVVETVTAGAHGVHVDDHLGTAGGLWLGICFCDQCVAGFLSHLRFVHLLNYAYDASRDDVQPLTDVQVQLDLNALGIDRATTCTFISPQAEPQSLTVDDGTVIVPALNLWGMLAF